MTPKQLLAAIKLHGLSQRKLAKALDINERTMRRYVAGELPIPKVVEFAIAWVTRAGREE